MAEDFDVEAMLEAPYRKDTYEVKISLTPSTRVEYRVAEDALDPAGFNYARLPKKG